MRGIHGSVFALVLSGCALFTPANLPKTEEVAQETKDALCAIEHAFLDDASLNAVCNLLSAERQAAAKKVREAHRTAMAKQLRAEHCSPDAGIEAGQ